jgi:hypothetical protein
MWDAKMKRFKTIRFVRRENPADRREPTILDHGDPITVKLTRELEERRRRLSLGATHPAGL